MVSVVIVPSIRGWVYIWLGIVTTVLYVCVFGGCFLLFSFSALNNAWKILILYLQSSPWSSFHPCFVGWLAIFYCISVRLDGVSFIFVVECVPLSCWVCKNVNL